MKIEKLAHYACQIASNNNVSGVFFHHNETGMVINLHSKTFRLAFSLVNERTSLFVSSMRPSMNTILDPFVNTSVTSHITDFLAWPIKVRRTSLDSPCTEEVQFLV